MICQWYFFIGVNYLIACRPSLFNWHRSIYPIIFIHCFIIDWIMIAGLDLKERRICVYSSLVWPASVFIVVHITSGTFIIGNDNDSGLYASLLKGKGRQCNFVLGKDTLWGNCKFVLEHFKHYLLIAQKKKKHVSLSPLQLSLTNSPS